MGGRGGLGAVALSAARLAMPPRVRSPALWRPVALVAAALCVWLAHHCADLLGVRLQPQRVATGATSARWWRRGGRGAAGSGTHTPPVPLNFIRAEPTLAKAEARWAKTLAWRAAERVDSILIEPNRVFYALKAHYPHFIHLPDLEGHITYWEFPGRLNMSALKQLGISPDEGIRHWVWHSEYTWGVVAPREGAQATVLFDAGGFGWEKVSLELVELIKRIVSFTNQHYPHRAARIIILNTPAWYGALYNILKPIMSDVCEAKLLFLSPAQVAAGELTKYIDAANLPPAYGGRSKVALGESKHEKAMRSFVDKVNRRAGIKPVMPLR